MDRRVVFSLWIVCTLFTLVVAAEPGTRRSEGLDGGAVGTPAPSEGAARDPDPPRLNGAASSPRGEIVDGTSPGERERVERPDNEERRLEDHGNRDEDVDGDEYEDELKAVAESHEAMSRDDTRNSNASAATSSPSVRGAFVRVENFDSREVIAVNGSDEDVASNEAITDELDGKYDQEVAELLKYKKQGNASEKRPGGEKTKRVPTVKKELSTQKEILYAGNETQVPRSPASPEVSANRLNDETETVRRTNGESIISVKENFEYPAGSRNGEILTDGRYSVPEVPKQLDKRQEQVLRDLKSLLEKRTALKREQQKLLQLAAQEEARSACLLQQLLKVSENTSGWDWLQKLLPRKDLNCSTSGPDSASSLSPATTPGSSFDPRKSRKKLKKKKKKKPKHRVFTTTSTPVPATPSLLTTTETPWQTTPVQWRLVAERLFDTPWQQERQEESKKIGTPRHSSGQRSRSLPSIRDLIEQSKPNSHLESSFSTDRKPITVDQVGDLAIQRFGSIGAWSAGQIPRHRDFADLYETSPDLPEPAQVYEAPEPYTEQRFDQVPPRSRDFLRRHEPDYPDDTALEADGFQHDQEFDGRPSDLSLNWPDLSFGYPSRWRMEERPAYPAMSDKWPWRQSGDTQHWPRRKFLPLEKDYWPGLSSEEETNREKMWQRSQHSWNRDRSAWPLEKTLKTSFPSWQHSEKLGKSYDRGSATWEKERNRSELSQSPTRQETKDKDSLPQISMKTWNSLTSDPATWPHKLPGAKPWPKDENGKAYNPNADLVKKLGLDKQDGQAWTKEQPQKPNGKDKGGRSRLVQSEEYVEEEPPKKEKSQYKSPEDTRDYKPGSDEPRKPWTLLGDSKGNKDWSKAEQPQGDDPVAWHSKYNEKDTWDREPALPKIQSVGAWVMAADQSTWKPYQIKPIDQSSENASGRWSKSFHRGSWSEKVNDSWLDQSNVAFWPGKSSKAWIAQAKDSDSWKTKDEWSGKPGPETWMPKVPENDWVTRAGPWSTKSNGSWTSKTGDDGTKFRADAWPSKIKEEDSAEVWSSKSSERNGWGSKGAELSPWQRKINDEWTYGKSSSTGAWPSKWKQFAYHRVTAVPISKPGTAADAAPSRSKNAFVAVSAVSSPKYTGSEWRKTDEDSRSEIGRTDEQERSSSQPQMGLERPIYAWKKDPGPRTDPGKGNSSDILENQLEALRQIDYWAYKARPEENSTSTVEETTSQPATNFTLTTVQRRGSSLTENGHSQPVENRRTLSMK